MYGKELDIEEFSIQQLRIILFLDFIEIIYGLILLLCFGLHQYKRAMILSKDISKVKLPTPKIPSFSLINLTIEYGVVPAITIESETSVKVTPHFLSAKRAEDEIIPTIAAGQPRLLAKVMLAALYGGIKIVIKVIVGRATILEINPNQAKVQYPVTLSFIIYCLNYLINLHYYETIFKTT